MSGRNTLSIKLNLVRKLGFIYVSMCSAQPIAHLFYKETLHLIGSTETLIVITYGIKYLFGGLVTGVLSWVCSELWFLETVVCVTSDGSGY